MGRLFLCQTNKGNRCLTVRRKCGENVFRQRPSKPGMPLLFLSFIRSSFATPAVILNIVLFLCCFHFILEGLYCLYHTFFYQKHKIFTEKNSKETTFTHKSHRFGLATLVLRKSRILLTNDFERNYKFIIDVLLSFKYFIFQAWKTLIFPTLS